MRGRIARRGPWRLPGPGLIGAALAHAIRVVSDLLCDHLVVMNMCGRGDKDIFTVARALGFDMGS